MQSTGFLQLWMEESHRQIYRNANDRSYPGPGWLLKWKDIKFIYSIYSEIVFLLK